MAGARPPSQSGWSRGGGGGSNPGETPRKPRGNLGETLGKPWGKRARCVWERLLESGPISGVSALVTFLSSIPVGQRVGHIGCPFWAPPGRPDPRSGPSRGTPGKWRCDASGSRAATPTARRTRPSTTPCGSSSSSPWTSAGTGGRSPAAPAATDRSPALPGSRGSA